MEMKRQVHTHIIFFQRSTEGEIPRLRTTTFKQLRSLRWPDLSTLLGLLCVSSSVYCSFRGFFAVAYILLLAQFIFDYLDGKLARTIGGGEMGTYLDSFSDFMSVAAAVVFGWFVGIDNLAMYIAGFLNI